MRQVASGKSMDVSPTYQTSVTFQLPTGIQADLGQEDCIQLWIVLEPRQDSHSLPFSRSTVDE